jgi:hypothetical protein
MDVLPYWLYVWECINKSYNYLEKFCVCYHLQKENMVPFYYLLDGQRRNGRLQLNSKLLANM